MITYVRFRIPNKEISKFMDCSQGALTKLKNSSGFLSHELSQCLSEKENFILRIQWQHIAPLEDYSIKNDAFNDFFEELNGYTQDILEMRNYKIM